MGFWKPTLVEIRIALPILTISNSSTESVGTGGLGWKSEEKMKNEGINHYPAHRTSWIAGMGPVGVSGFASLSKGRPTVKKLLGSLLIGALVSMGCSNQNKGTVKATEKVTKVSSDTGHMGAGSGASHTGRSGVPTNSGGAHVKETKIGSGGTKVGETKSTKR